MTSKIVDKFLCRTALLRYSIITISFVFLGFITYYLLVVPFEEQYQNAQRDYRSLLDEADQLDNKANNYPKYQQLIIDVALLERQQQNHRVYSSNLLVKVVSQKLINNQLTLVDLNQQQDSNGGNLNFKLQGDYHNFIEFINQLAKLNLNISLKQISIIRSVDSLVFLLSITYQNERVEVS